MSIATFHAILWKLGNQSPSFARRRFQAGRERVVNNFQRGHCKLRRNIANVWHPLCNLQCFSVVIVARQVARRIASCNMAFTRNKFTETTFLCVYSNFTRTSLKHWLEGMTATPYALWYCIFQPPTSGRTSSKSKQLFLVLSRKVRLKRDLIKGHITRGNFSCNLSRNDGECKSLEVAERVSYVRNTDFFTTCNAPTGNDQLFLLSPSWNLSQGAGKRRQKGGVAREILLSTCNATINATQVARKIASWTTWP